MHQSVVHEIISTTLKNNNCCETIAGDICQAIMEKLPFKHFTEPGSFLSSAWRMEQYLHSQHCVIGVSNGKNVRTFLDVLRNILHIPEVLKYVLEPCVANSDSFTSYRSGQIFQENDLSLSVPFTLHISFLP